MAIEVIDFFDAKDRDNWLSQIRNSKGEASEYLAQLLEDNKLKSLCGESTSLYMLTEDGKLYSFCTLAEQDEIKAPNMSPWIGFVYTFPEYRGNYFGSTLIDIVCEKAQERGYKRVYVSPSEDTKELYLKLGFTCEDYPMTTIYGYETNVYSKDL